MVLCPACLKENPDDAQVCTFCGANLQEDQIASGAVEPVEIPSSLEDQRPSDNDAVIPEGDDQVNIEVAMETQSKSAGGATEAPIPEAITESYSPEPSEPLPPPKATSRSYSPRCLGCGCLVVLVFVFVIVPLIYYFGIRPPLESRLLDQLDVIGRSAYTIVVYSGDVQTESISQDDANALADELWGQLRGVEDGKIRFEQDQIVVQATFLKMPLEARADLRVDDEGKLLVKSVRLNWAAYLFFSPSVLSNAVSDHVNNQVLRGGNLSLKAIQVTPGEIFIAYGER